MKRKRSCSKCKKPIKDREGHVAIVHEDDWNPFENAYDLLTKPKRWLYYHEPSCKKSHSLAFYVFISLIGILILLFINLFRPV